MREDQIRWQNEKYYYCENYIWLFRKIGIIPIVFVFLMWYASCMIRKLFLLQLFFTQSAKTLLEDDMDVMQWINAKMVENQMDAMAIFIIAINFLVAFSIILSLCKIESYNLYKMGWIKAIPIALYSAEILIMCWYYYATNLIPLIIALILKFFPVLLSSRLLYPLESRPTAKSDTNLFTIIFDGVTKVIIDKL